MIDWDANAGGVLRPEVAALLNERFQDAVRTASNPSSVHRSGRRARTRLDQARAECAQVLGVEPREVVFTASGSEANALALKGAFFARTDPTRRRIVASSIEHPAVLFTLEQLKGHGADIVLVDPDRHGQLQTQALVDALTPGTLLCSLQWANNETGVLQPVAAVARACRDRGVLFHTDAVQAVGKVSVTVRDADADLLSLSAHKFGGPVGVGALVVRRGTPLEPLVPGHQEAGLRGGTSAVALVEALALALRRSVASLEVEGTRLSGLRDRFEQMLGASVPGVAVNGLGAPRLTNTSNVCFDGIDGEALFIALDLAGIAVSSGAACASGAPRPSHVLRAMGLSTTQAQASLRFSLGHPSTEDEVDRVVAALVEQVPAARASQA